MTALETTGWTDLNTAFGQVRVAAFRSPDSHEEHFALLKGDVQSGMLVRVHSECLTGDVFSSLHCDCGGQLALALEEISQNGGLLLYLRQEGRGIGLFNKLQAYKLQAGGANTLEANEMLGFPPDARAYKAASEFMKAIGLREITLLTNNPDKIRQLTELGVVVRERRASLAARTPENANYLDTKHRLFGHFLKDIE